MANYLLLHGSLSGGWCWTKVKKILEGKGHKVCAPDLPGHEIGSHVLPSEITMDRYVSFVCNLIESEKKKVIWVGHSLGGAVITKVMDEISDDFVERAYYVSALIPRNGDVIGNMLKEDTGSELHNAIKMKSDTKSIEFEWEAAREIYYGGCSNEDLDLAQKMVLPQSVIPFSSTIELKREKGIRCIGIVSEKDRSLTPGYQRRMYESADCEILSIDSGHAPFFSHSVELAEILMRE